jgi:hypothetical protein
MIIGELDSHHLQGNIQVEGMHTMRGCLVPLSDHL